MSNAIEIIKNRIKVRHPENDNQNIFLMFQQRNKPQPHINM
jgi:hypothetical protein